MVDVVTLERIAEIIRIAGQSRAGFVALVLVFLFGVVIVVLDRAPPMFRTFAYCGLVIGICAFSWVVYQAALLPPGTASLN